MITPIITSTYQQKYQYKKGLRQNCSNLAPLSFDTVSFKSINLLGKNSKEISEIVKEAVIHTENIGFGSEGTVYKIPDTDYCVKILKGESINNFGHWRFNVSEQDKINHIVAKSNNDSVIMKHLDGRSLKWNKPDEIFELPKSSYKNLLIQLEKAKDECLKFDNSPSNVIYNPKDKSLTAIDFYEPSPDVEFEYTPLSSVFTVLKNHSDSSNYVENNRKLGGKLLEIVLDEFSSGKEPEFEIDKRDIFDVFGELKMESKFNEPTQMRFLRESFADIFRLRELPKTEENNKKYNWNIMYSKAIIRQVLG